MSWRESDIIEDSVTEWGWCGWLLGTALVMFPVSAILDTCTPCPTIVWILLWACLPVLAALFPVLAYWSHPNNRIDISGIKEVMQRYDYLNKDQKQMIPKTAIKAMKNRELSAAHRRTVATEVDDLIKSIQETEHLASAVEIENILEDVRNTKASIKIANDTYKEFA